MSEKDQIEQRLAEVEAENFLLKNSYQFVKPQDLLNIDVSKMKDVADTLELAEKEKVDSYIAKVASQSGVEVDGIEGLLKVKETELTDKAPESSQTPEIAQTTASEPVDSDDENIPNRIQLATGEIIELAPKPWNRRAMQHAKELGPYFATKNKNIERV